MKKDSSSQIPNRTIDSFRLIDSSGFIPDPSAAAVAYRSEGLLAYSAIPAFSKIKIPIYLIHIHRQAVSLRRVIGTTP
jgi:hypothetical protein